MANGEGEQPEKKMILRGRTPEEDGDGEEEEEEQVQEEQVQEEEEQEEQALTLAQLSTSSTSSTPPPALSMNGVEYLQTGLQLPTPLVQLRHISSSRTLLGWRRWRSLGI